MTDSVLAHIVRQMDYWLADDAPRPDRALVVEWANRLRDLDDPHRPEVLLIAPAWTPTAESIKALPYPIRNYIQLLENRADPSSDLRELVLARRTIRTLGAKLAACEANQSRHASADAPTPYLTADEAASYLRYPSTHWFRIAVKKYGIPRIRRGRRLFFTKQALDAFMAVADEATNPRRGRRRR